MIEIRHNGGVILTPKLEDSSYKRRDLSGTDEIVLKFSSNEHVDIPVGSTIEWRGSTYTLETPESLKMQHSEHFEYVATFSAPSVRIGKYKVINQVDGRVDFHLTAKPKEHLQLIVDNLNKRESGWAIGNCIEDSERLIQYNHTDCRTALSSIAEEFKTELFIEGKVISLSTVEKDKSNPVTLAYGEGKGFLGGIGRTHDKDAGARVAYVKTSDRNIDYSKYKSKSLRLKRNHRFSYRGYSFVTDDSGLSVRFADAPKDSREEVVDLSNIYPSRVGIVSEVIEVPVKTKDGQETTFYDFIDTTIPDALDFDKEVISGEKLTIIFQSGMLSGREFDVKYHAKELAGEKPKKAKRFEIVQKEEDGVTMPLGAFVPAIGDKYAVFHCSLPQSYIDEAEKKALEKACDFLIEELKPRFEFSGEVDGIFAKNKWSEIAHKLEVGKFVSFTDERFQPEPILVRIVGVTEFLNNPYSPKIELSNAPVTGNVFSEIKEAIREEQTLRYKQDVKIRQLEARTYKDTETVRDMIEQLKVEGFDSAIKPETLRTMQAVIGSPELQFDFVRSEFDLTETPFAYSFGKGGTEITIPQQYLRKYKNSNKLSSVKESVVYTIPQLTYSFKEDQRQMYLYAQTAPVKRFVLSAEPLQKSEDNNLVGLVYASGDSRRMTPLHGFTEITPGQLKTDLISSQDGKSFWDLINGKFQSKGDFVLGDIEGGGQVFAKVGDKFYMRGIMINVGSGRRTIEDAIAEQEEKAEAERKAREAAIEKERREREQADAAERRAREAKEREFTQAIEQAKQSGAQDVATLTDLLNKANQKLGALEKQVDKEVSNWFYAGAPSANKLPESEWTTNAIKANHINDTYTSIDKSGRYQGKSWRYTTEFKWQEIHDTQISQALAMAAKAQTTADGKSTTYLSKPTKYEEGDTWVLESTQTVNGTRYEKGTYLFATQSSSVFVQAHWVDKLKYISKSETESKIRASESASKLAWEAYAKAQAEAERVKAEAHADGKVTAEEQARIDAVNKALQAAKAYAEAQDKLLKTQQEAYADGKVTAAERNAIAVSQARAKLAEENAKAYADGIVDKEEKARIAAAQKAYDDAVAKAKELDGQIQVGGRNLFVISNFRSLRHILLGTNDEKVLPLSRGEDSTGAYVTQTDQQFGVTSRLSTYVVPSTTYNKECYNDIVRTPGITLWESFEVKVSAKMDLWMDDKNKVTVSPEDGWVRLFKKRNGGNEYTRMYGIYGTFPAANVKVWYRRPMITEGDVRVITYTPAPEDVQAEIDAVERGYQKLIERVDVEFAISNSRDTAPESGWQTNAPTPARGQALWQRTKVYLKDGTTEVRGVTCIQGKDGLDGKDGAKGGDGADGRGIAKIVELYYLSSSNTALANGAWTETAPTPKEGFWIWTKTRIHYSTGEQIETQPICVTGNKGDKGDRGQDAVNFDMGRMLYQDPTFKSGYNNCVRYNNGEGEVTLVRIARESDTPTTSTHMLRYKILKGATSPGGGGFCWGTKSRANAVMVTRVIAKLQVGVTIAFASNMTGDGKYGDGEWITPRAGTGKYEEYIYRLKCGSSGTFSTTNYVYFSDLKVGQEVCIAYATVYDMTDAPDYYDKIKAEAEARGQAKKELEQGILRTNTLIKTLERAQQKLERGLLSKADVAGIQYLLDSLQKGSTDFAGGILLTNDIILSSPNSGKVTATLSGSAVQGHKALRLGIQDSGKELTAFSNDGTGHVGPLYFRGGMLEFVDESEDTQVLAIGKGTMSKRLNDIINSNSVNSYLINNANGSLNYHNEVESWVLNVSNDNTKIVVKGKLRARGQVAQSAGENLSFSGCGITLSIDGVGTIGTAGSMCTCVEGLFPNCTLGMATINSVFYLNRGRYTVTVRQNGNGETSYEDLSLQQIWSSNNSFNAISEKGVRFYGSRDKYFDLNYSLPSNLETVKICGGMNVDYINTSGAVLAGAKFNREGGMDKQFGRYCIRQGFDSASASYNDRTGVFTVYHSIPHSNYVPMITISEANSARTSTVIGISPYSFQIQIFSGFNKTQAAFSYVAFQAD